MRLTRVILGTWEAEVSNIMVPGEPRQKVMDTPSQSIAWWHIPAIPATKKGHREEDGCWRLLVGDFLPRQKIRFYLKNRSGGVVQVVDHLPSKHKALSTNPSMRERQRQRDEHLMTPGRDACHY
jgi:hypothetical protein